MANLETLELTINGSSQQASQGIDTLISHLSSLSNALTKPYSDLRDFNSALKETAKLAKSINFKNIGKGISAAVAKGAGESAKESVKASIPTAEDIAKSEEINAKIRGQGLPAEAQAAQQAVSRRIMQERIAATAAKRAAMEARQRAAEEAKVAQEISETTKATEQNESALAKVKAGFKNMASGVTGFFSKVKRIATTMLIRSAIRGLIKDIKEGVNNVYEWSKANNGTFAQSFDTLKAKSLQLKNSIGAAITPVISAAIPVINALASAAIHAFNWVNQLISLLTGKGSWTKATEGVNDYADAVNGAGGAAQKWLAAFDELNVMTSGGGGGGGAAAVEYSNMFEEQLQFDSKIRELADFLKDNAESIRDMAIATGVAILGWKLASGFAETLPALSKIAGLIGVGATIAITLQANWLLTNQYLNTGEEGWLIADLLTTAIGSAGAAFVAQKIFGGQAAVWTVSFTLAMSAFTGIKAVMENADVSTFSKESIVTLIENALKAGVAAGILLKTIGNASVLTAATGAATAALVVFGVSIGLKAALDPNVQLFSAEHIGSAVAAAVAVGLGTLLFTSSVPGAGIAAVATFFALVALKLTTTKDHIIWGNVSLTEAQIDSFVRDRMFEADPNIIINIISQNVKAGEVQRDQIQKDLMDMMGTFEMIKLGINMSESFARMRDQVDRLINDVHEYTINAQDTGKLTLQFTPTLVGNTPEEQAEWFKGYEAGWKIVDEWYEAKGKEIGDLFVENEKGQIELKNPELLQTIMSSISEITNAITESDIVSDALSNMKLGLGDMTEATGTQIIESFKQYKIDLEAAYSDLVAEQYRKQGELVAALGKIDPNSEEYKQAVADYETMGQNMAKAVQDGVESKIQPGKDVVTEWLFGNHAAGSATMTWTEDYLKGFLNVDGLTQTIKNILTENGFEQVELDAMDLIGISGWDFLSTKAKTDLVNALGGIDNADTIAKLKKELKLDASQIIEVANFATLSTKGRTDLVTALVNAFGTDEAIAAIKKKIPNISAGGIISMTDWKSFTSEQQLSFITAVKNAFGAEEAKKAAKNAGINIGSLVKTGMNSKNEDIKKQAESWSGIINTGVKKTTPVVTPKLKDKIDTTLANTVKATIEKTSAVVSKVTAAFQKGYPGNLKTDVEKNVKPSVSVTAAVTKGIYDTLKKNIQNNTKPSVSVGATVSTGTYDNLKKNIQKYAATSVGVGATINKGTYDNLKKNIQANTNPSVPTGASIIKGTYDNLKNNIEAWTKPDIKANVTATGISKIADDFRKALSKALSLSVSGVVIGSAKISVKAGGGTVDSGDLFVANENGVPEMIGRFGNQTGVANTGQIVAGISKGVAEANVEQNALLREQNGLLRRILAKETNLNLGASSGLGRTVQQSLDMYSALTGG